MKIKSFGCSFIYGSDLSDCQQPASPPSEKSWPALLAKKLNLDHRCYAKPGIGNLRILECLLHSSISDDLYIINWTWIDRFDFIDARYETWETLRPSLDHASGEFYYRNLHSQHADLLTNLIYIKTAVDYLLANNKKFIMTAIDDLLFEKIDPNRYNSRAIEVLQTSIKPHINVFEGKNFLDWSRKKRYPVSNTWHPLEEAHSAAADYMLPIIESILRKA